MSVGGKTHKGMFTYLSFSLSHALFSTVFYVLMQIASALVPVLLLNANARFIDSLTDSYAAGRFTTDAFQSAAFLLAAIFIQFLLPTAAAFIGMRLSIRLSTAYDLHLAQKKSRIKFSLMESSDTYELMERVSEDCSSKMFDGMKSIFAAAEYLIRLLGIAVTVACSNLVIGVMAGLLLTLIIPIAIKGGQEDYEAYAESSKRFRRTKYLKGVISGRDSAAERSLFRFSDWMIQKWNQWFTEGRLFSQKATRRNFIRIKSGSIIAVLICGGIMLLMLPGLKNGTLTVGLYTATITAIVSLSQLMTWNVAYVVEDVVTANQYISDYNAFMTLEERAQPSPGMSVSPRNITCIEFCNVSFRYPHSDTYALHNFSFRFSGCKTYAIVGENGSGKSTLVKLMLGLFDTYEGNIFINGRELRLFRHEELCDIFSCAFQDFARYELSIRDNIAIGTGDKMDSVSEEAIHSVLEEVGLSAYIAALPNGIHTHLGRLEEDGSDISGGQWQRIAIARALIKKASVCIMDEPTAALDPESEQSIYHLLYEMFTDKLGILITHRLGGASKADEILVLRSGKLVEEGTFDKLMTANGTFSELYALQRRWYQ